MTTLLTLILDAGGLLLKTVLILVLLVLQGLIAGLIAATCVVLVSCLTVADKEYRKSLFVSESDRQKLLDGNG